MLSLFNSQVPVLKPMDLMVEVSPRRVFANAHTYHVNSISVNSDYETYMSADDLRINLWHLDITDRSFSILCGFVSVWDGAVGTAVRTRAQRHVRVIKAKGHISYLHECTQSLVLAL